MRQRWPFLALAAVLLFGLGCAGVPFGAEEVVLGDRPAESPFTWPLIGSWVALTLGGGAAILGIWVGRDKARPALFAVALSVLIFTAICVGGLQGFLDEEQAIETRADLERILDMVDGIAANSSDPALRSLVEKNEGRRRARPAATNGGATKPGGE